MVKGAGLLYTGEGFQVYSHRRLRSSMTSPGAISGGDDFIVQADDFIRADDDTQAGVFEYPVD